MKEGRRALWKAEQTIRVLQVPDVSDRKGIAFYLPETRIQLDELPDDFYELSKSETKMLYHEIVQKRKEIEEKPMMTANMRELEKARKMRELVDRYKFCIIRVQFADRSVLQGIFQPNEPFQEVIDFVRAHLRPDLDDFFLFTTPPKVVPDAQKTLLELSFVPGVKLYFGTPNTHFSTFLREDILVNIRTPDIAAKEAQNYRMSKGGGNKSQSKTDETTNSTSKSADNSAAAGPSKPKTGSSSSLSIIFPKWFKSSKK